MSRITETHEYDKKIGPIYRELLEIDNRELVEPIPFDECIKEIEELAKQKYLDIDLRDKIEKTIQLLCNDRKNNVDPLNEINVEDLLPRTWRFIKHYDELGKLCFLEQMTDIVDRGPCPQGRTTRIFQFYEYHMSNNTSDIIYTKALKKIDN